MLSVVPPADLAALALLGVLWLGHRRAVTMHGDSAINAGRQPVRALLRWRQFRAARLLVAQAHRPSQPLLPKAKTGE